MSVKSYKKIIFMYILSLFAVMGISIVINLKEDKNVRRKMWLWETRNNERRGVNTEPVFKEMN